MIIIYVLCGVVLTLTTAMVVIYFKNDKERWANENKTK